MIEIPQPLAEALEAELGSEKVPLGKEIRALGELHELFTKARSHLRGLSYLDDPPLRRAYLRYYVPLNAARAIVALENLRALGTNLGGLSTIVDLGAGPGTASAATLLAVPSDVPRTLILYDRSRAALAVARRLLERIEKAPGGTSAVSKVIAHVGRIPRSLPRIPGPCLLWASTILNELGVGLRGGPEATAFLEALAAALEPGSVAIFVEPALRVPARNLLRVHDAAVEAGAWRVLAPCTHQLPCPLLRERARPWCHFHFEWRAPRAAREVAEPLGLDTAKAFLSFLALRRESGKRSRGEDETELRRESETKFPRESEADLRREAQAPQPHRLARAIGDPMPVRGGRRGIYLCEEGRRRTLADPPPEVQRGDVIEIREGSPPKVVIEWPGKGTREDEDL